MKTIKLDDFKNYEFLSNLKFSEDGRYAAYICAHADLTENDYNKALFLLDMETKKTKQLTGEDVNSFYGFDGDRLLFSARRTKKEKEEKEKIVQGKDLPDNNYSAKMKNENNPVQDKEEDSCSQNFRPKWRH